VSKLILLDAGPWVAYILRHDRYHAWSREQFASHTRFVTCEAVVSEVCYRLAYYKDDPAKCLDFLRSGAVILGFDLQAESGRVAALMRKYSDAGMDLADACLVRMTELCDDQDQDCDLITIDSDFDIYRRNGTKKIPFQRPF
jgi:uncharacterized protein